MILLLSVGRMGDILLFRQKTNCLYMRWVCNKDAHPLAFSLSLGYKMMQQSPMGPAKSKHGAALCTCHRKRLDLFLRYKPDCLCVICTLLFSYGTTISWLLWGYCTTDYLFRKLLSWKMGRRKPPNLWGLGGLILLTFER